MKALFYTGIHGQTNTLLSTKLLLLLYQPGTPGTFNLSYYMTAPDKKNDQLSSRFYLYDYRYVRLDEYAYYFYQAPGTRYVLRTSTTGVSSSPVVRWLASREKKMVADEGIEDERDRNETRKRD